MGKVSAIEWTDATWSPWRGCTKVSAGCKNCYAERRAKRLGEDFNTVARTKTTFRDPLKWEEPRLIFVCSLSDFFHEDVPEEWRRDAWEIMGHAKEHTFLLLTKRPENIPDMMPIGWIEGMHKYWKHVWLGVTAENQEMANLRIPLLLDVPAAKHFVSVEPMLGPVKLWQSWLPGVAFELDGTPWPSLDWVIAGGESDMTAPRPMDAEWVSSLLYQCQARDVPFCFKQWGGSTKINKTWGGRELMGRMWDESPQ